LSGGAGDERPRQVDGCGTGYAAGIIKCMN
jgi:hypothetical protein